MLFKNQALACVLGLSLSLLSCETTETETTATLTSLDCSQTTFSASPVAGTAFSGTATVSYSGGNGGVLAAGQAVASTGVTGLTATLTAGPINTGTGSVTFALSGTPSTSGTAQFAITVAGQSCSISLPVSSTGISGGGGTTPTVGWGFDTDIDNILKFADAFKTSLSSTQVSALQYGYTLAQAQKWSNLPQSLYKNRVGLASSTFSTAQWTAFYSLLKATTGTSANEGYEEFAGIIDADDYLAANGGGSGYGSGNYYIAFLGTPSKTGLWSLQIGGHHGTTILTFQNGKLTGGTPIFRSTEPYPTWISTNTAKTIQPLVQETAAFAAFLKSLSAAELSTAKRSAAQNDIQVGPQKDGSFPTTKVGLRAGNLTNTQKEALLAAINTYVSDLDDKAAPLVLAKYKAELDDTYVSYYGGTTMAAKGDYLLIDGPSVWIEWSMQGGIVIRNGVHPHSVWRDRKADYGAN